MLSPEELEIIRRAKELGKTREEALAGISKYRASKNTAFQQPKEQGIVSRVGDVINKAGQQVNQAIQGEGQYAGQSPITRGFSAVSSAALAIPQTVNAALPEPVRKVNEYIGEKVGQGFNAVTGEIASTKLFSEIGQLEAQGFINPQDNPEFYRLKEQLSVAKSSGEVAGTILSAKGTAKTAQGAVDVTGKLVAPIKNKAAEVTSKATSAARNTIEDFGNKVTAPSVSDATRVSLNPQKALKGTGQDMNVTVGGKIKKLSELTPDENSKMQFSTQKSINKFTEEAKKFKNNRNPANDPTEIVGKRVDAALTFADKKRMAVGRKMGDIEAKYADQSLPIGDKTLNKFSETLKSIDNPKFGVDSADAPIVKKLVEDFDNLESGGATVADRMDFVRSWDKYLKDSKDAFGNFKENATANTRIQSAVRTLKDETVDAISAQDKVYRGLRGQYSTYKKLDEIGNQLLGKDGALGDRIKGGATVKRALKSNSDAGARQFLTQLKELTGYDAIKDGDLALTAMQNVGDFQGLSLLEILQDGKTGVVSKGLEYAQNKVFGDEATRVDRFIKKK